MQFNDLPAQLIAELKQGSPGLIRLADNEDALGRLIKAYEAQDARAVRVIIEELQLVPYCQVICTWLCTWHCFRVCRVLNIEMPSKPTEDVDLRNYALGLSKLAGDEKATKLLIDAVASENADNFAQITEQFDIQPFGYLLCYWICHIRCRRFCYLVCPPIEPVLEPDLVAEFRETAAAIGRLAEDEGAFLKTLEAYNGGDIDTVQDLVARFELPCIFICRWLCITYCFRLCYILCPKIPRRFTVKDLQDFLVNWRALVNDPCGLDELVEAIDQRDAKLFASVVERFGYQRLCYFLCHWICFRWCRLYCRVICPPRLICNLEEPVGCVPEELLQQPAALVVPVRGTASGIGFDHYILEWSTDDATYQASNFMYPPIPPGTATQGNTPVLNSLLAYFNTTLLDDGDYFIRLTVFATNGVVRQCKTQFSLFKQDVRILGINGFTNLDQPAFDPNARFVDNYTEKCTAISTIEEASFAGQLAFEGSAFVGGCDEKEIKRYKLYYKEGHETDCGSTGWTEFWNVEYDTVAKYREMNMRRDTSTLTAVWVDDCVVNVPFPPYCLLNLPSGRLAPRRWNSASAGNCELSGLYTIKLEVEDTEGATYCDLQRVWFDNKRGHAVIKIKDVEPCQDLNIGDFIPDVPDCSVPWPLDLEGIAYDEYIDESLPTGDRPNDNFSHYTIIVRRQGGPQVQIPIDAPDGSCFFGVNRVGVPGTRCEGSFGPDIHDILAKFDLRALDAECVDSTSYSIPPGFALQRGECCVYTFWLRVYDTTKRLGGGTQVDFDSWPVKICNNL